jgi:hypothetical protein
MKKRMLSLAVICCLAGATAAQAQSDRSFYKTPYKARNNGTYDRSTGILSLGYGFPNLSGTGYTVWGWGAGVRHLGVGPAYLKYEHAIRDEIGIGGYAAVAASRHRYGPNERYTDRVTAFGMGVLGYYHFNKLIPVRNLDVYAGVGIGFRNLSYTYDNGYNVRRGSSSDFVVLPIAKAGVRYYVTRGFGFYGEAGYDNMSSMNLGISFRF